MKEYKVIGVLNAFDVWPCFLQVVFSNEDKLFFQMHSKDKIYGFEEIRAEIPLDDKIIPVNYDKCAKEGDLIISAVGFNKDDIIVGTPNDIILDLTKNQDKYFVNKEFSEDINNFVIEYGV